MDGPILTPDRRVRVFVSSTLEELANERAAVQAAVERLRLSPVLFELGARPYPPRPLYLAYLRQSDVFVGIYWQSYGWVAPGADLSGLEDELRESAGMPRLIYMKHPAPERDARLTALLDGLLASNVSYKRFGTADELERIVVDDLALLLTEHFASGSASDEEARVAGLPTPASAFVGRQADIAALEDLLRDGGPRLVTLTGPGGVGKTRLALQVASTLSTRDGVRVAFVPLSAAPTDALRDTVATALGLYDRGGHDLDSLITAYLRDHPLLLLLDNFEHLVASASWLRTLLEAAPGLRILVTSRTALRVSGEQEFVVDPLAVPTASAHEPARVTASEAVQLFVNRVSVVRRGFRVDNDNAVTIAEICRRLDGLPLAIELVAARAHVLSLDELRDHLGDILDLPARAPDVEERHRSLRRTLDWSTRQLTAHEADAFNRLGVFAGSFTGAAATAILGNRADDDVIDVLAVLVDHSLVRADLSSPGAARFSMLEIVRDYARSRLGDDEDTAFERHATYFRDLATEAYTASRGASQGATFTALDADFDDIGAAADWLLAHDRVDDVVAITWALWLYFWQRGLLTTARRWTQGALTHHGTLSSTSRARLLAADSFLAMWQRAYDGLVDQLLEAGDLAKAAGDDTARAHVQLALMMVYGALGAEQQAAEVGQEALALARRQDDAWTEAYVLTGVTWLSAGTDRFDNVADFEAALRAAHAVDDPVCVAMALANLAELRAHQGHLDDAARLLTDSLELCADLSIVYVGAGVLDDASAVLTRAGQIKDGAEAAAASTAALQDISASLFASRADRLTRRMATSRLDLGEDAFTAAWNEGLSRSFSQAVATAVEALARVDRPVTARSASRHSWE